MIMNASAKIKTALLDEKLTSSSYATEYIFKKMPTMNKIIFMKMHNVTQNNHHLVDDRDLQLSSCFLQILMNLKEL